MPPVPQRIRELRNLISTTFNTAHTDASSGPWAAGTARKPKAIEVDISGLEYDSEPDPTLDAIHTVNRANIPTLRGPKSAKFGMWLEGGNSDGSENELATQLAGVMGGVEAGAATAAVEAGSTTTAINSTGIGANLSVGQGVMIGVKGDAAGAAEGRVVLTDNADDFVVGMVYTGAPAALAAIRIGTTVFWDPTATQSYFDLLAIGKSAEDQWQGIGGNGPISLEGLAPGDLPKVMFDIVCADWQVVPTGERDALEPATAATGNAPAHLRGTGALLIGDNGNTARGAYKISDLSIDPGITYEVCEGMNGINGVEGWVKIGCRPVVEATIALEGGTDPLPGFMDDFEAGTAKQVFIQFGSTSGRACLIDLPRAFFTVGPTRVEGGTFASVKITMHGGAPPTMTESTANYLANSPIRFHFF